MKNRGDFLNSLSKLLFPSFWVHKTYKIFCECVHKTVGFAGITAFKEPCKELTGVTFLLKFLNHVQGVTKSGFYNISDMHCEFSVHLPQVNYISYLLEVGRPNNEWLYLVTPTALSPLVRSKSGCSQQGNSSVSQHNPTDWRHKPHI